jgi:hypothetical protein
MMERFHDFLSDSFGNTPQSPQLTLIFDKGNNSQDNFSLIDTLKRISSIIRGAARM